jgi:two-component system, LytTR family, sensor kinase
MTVATHLTPFRLSRVALAVAVLGTAFGGLQAAMFYISLQQEGGLPFVVSFPRIMAWQLSSWLVWAALAPAVLVLGARWTPERPLLFLAVHLPAGLTAAVLHATADLFLNTAFRPFGQRRPVVPQLVGHITNSLNVELLIYFVILGAGYAIDYYRRFRDRELRAAQLEGRLAEARLEALQLQLQPHFLFNTLHTVAGLVRQGENPAAVEMLARLSDLLRATLEGGGLPLVPLRQELALADLYLAIQQVRFADRLRVERAIDPALLDIEVPPFVLQPLLENAVRHGLAVRAGAGSLRIVAERSGDQLRLAVEDDGRGLAGGKGVEGVGLGNTRARLAQLFGDEARLELLDRPTGGAIARLTLPIAREAAVS